MSDDRVILNKEQVDEMLKSGEYVHTFIQAGNGCLIGCDMKRSDILAMAETGGAELSGDVATSMGHGLVVWDRKKPVFCDTQNA